MAARSCVPDVRSSSSSSGATSIRVGAAEKRFQRCDRDLVQRLLGGGADFGVGILEQHDEDGELLVRARRQQALRGFHADVALDLAALEEIEERSGAAHRACR
jgi:hypothetical protein